MLPTALDAQCLVKELIHFTGSEWHRRVIATKGVKKSAMVPCLVNSVNPAVAKAAATPNTTEHFHSQKMSEMSVKMANCVQL